jgi:hypothetical protein
MATKPRSDQILNVPQDIRSYVDARLRELGVALEEANPQPRKAIIGFDSRLSALENKVASLYRTLDAQRDFIRTLRGRQRGII